MNASRGGNVMVGFLDNGAFTPFHAFYSVAGGESFDIGTLDPANRRRNRSSFATDVSDNGTIIVGYSDTVGGATWHASFRWSAATGMVDLGSGNGSGGFSRAFGVSGDGTTIVGESDFPGGFSGTVRQAFRWTAAGGMVSLGSISRTGIRWPPRSAPMARRWWASPCAVRQRQSRPGVPLERRRGHARPRRIAGLRVVVAARPTTPGPSWSAC